MEPPGPQGDRSRSRTLFSYDRLYVGGGNATKIEPPLPPRVKIISNLEGLLGGIALWESKEQFDGR